MCINWNYTHFVVTNLDDQGSDMASVMIIIIVIQVLTSTGKRLAGDIKRISKVSNSACKHL